MDRNDLYPGESEVGEADIWHLPLRHSKLTIEAVFLGLATSQQGSHSHPGEFVTDSRKCPRCRWFEPRIFRETGGSRRYVLYTIGCSDVPGERDLLRYRYARDPFEAVAIMKTAHPVTGHRDLVGVTRRMFAQAVVAEPDLTEALTAEGVIFATGEGWRV